MSNTQELVAYNNPEAIFPCSSCKKEFPRHEMARYQARCSGMDCPLVCKPCKDKMTAWKRETLNRKYF